MLAEHGLELMGSFLPLRFSRPGGFEEDLAAMEGALDTLDAAATGGVRPFVLLADAFLEPDRLQHAGDIEAHPETWLPPDRAELLVRQPRARGRPLPRARIPGLAPLPRGHLHRDAARGRAGGVGDRHRPDRPVLRHGPHRVRRRRSARLPQGVRRACEPRPHEGRRHGAGSPRCAPRAATWSRPGSAASSARSARATRTSASASTSSCGAGYDGWIVVEQDRVLGPDEPFSHAVADGEQEPRLPGGARAVTRAADLGRRRRLHRISAGGVFALVACDHRDSLRLAFEGRGVAAPEGAEIGCAQGRDRDGAGTRCDRRADRRRARSRRARRRSRRSARRGDAARGAGLCRCRERPGHVVPAGLGPEAPRSPPGPMPASCSCPSGPTTPPRRAAQLEVVARGRRRVPRGRPAARARADRLPARRTRTSRTHADAFPRLVVAGVERLVPLGADIMKVQFPKRRRRGRRGGVVQAASMPRAARRRGCSSAAAQPTRRSPPRSRRRAGPARPATSSGARPGRAPSRPTPSERRRWLAEVGAPRLRAVRERAAALARPFTSRVPAMAAYPPDWYSRAGGDDG